MLYVNANKHTNIDRFILWKSDQEDTEKVNFFDIQCINFSRNGKY